MDIQMRRGLLEVAVLAAIKQQDSYGYQIIKDTSSFVEISESTLYPILRRLEGGGLLTEYKMEHNGRLRKYYRITDAGRTRLAEFGREWEEMNRIYRFVIRGEDGND